MEKCSRCGCKNIYIDSEVKYHIIFRCISCDYLMIRRFKECCQNPLLNVTIDDKNTERRRLHRQCSNCGGCVDRTRPLSFKNYSNEIRFEFSHLNYNKWLNDIDFEKKQIYKWISEANYNTSKYAKYRNYLISENWLVKRNQVLKRDKNICQVCNNLAEEVHHKTYKNLYNEPLDDLVSLCRNCHIEVHKNLDEKKRKEITNQIEEKGIY